MKNLTTGTGLALLAGAIVAFPLINRLSSIDQAAHAAPPLEAAKAIAAASTAQVTPTIVWYGISTFSWYGENVVTVGRAWSDGRVEIRSAKPDGNCSNSWQCRSDWTLLSDPNSGYNAASDINFDSKVDGSDLGQLLAAWGDAPRQDITPSDCPLNLINPR